MKSNGLIGLSALLGSAALGTLALSFTLSVATLCIATGCSSSKDEGTGSGGGAGSDVDAGAGTTGDAPLGDSARPDTAKVDTGRDTARPLCDGKLPEAFSCKEPLRAVTSGACSATQVGGYGKACVPELGGDPDKCKAWFRAAGACGKCVLAWDVVPDNGVKARNQCFAFRMTRPCAKAVECATTCSTTVCNDCTPDSAFQACSKRSRDKVAGQCYGLAWREADECLADETIQAAIKPCLVRQLLDKAEMKDPDPVQLAAELRVLIGGACQFKGDWNARPAGDAGPDDAGPGDAGGGDAALRDGGAAPDATPGG